MSRTQKIAMKFTTTIFLVVFLLISFSGTMTSKRKTPLKWGVYQILWSKEYESSLKKECSSFASKPDYVMFYRDMTCPFPKFAIDAVYNYGAEPMVSQELWNWGERKTNPLLQKIVDGSYDEFFANWAKAAKEDGRKVYYRFGFECNGDWFNWSGNPELFKKAWIHAHKIFTREKSNNVKWVWSPNILSVPKTPENNMHFYYPGDEYVDYVSLDGYNFGEKHDKWHTWESFEQIFDEKLKEFSLKYPGKKIIISEFGCASDKTKERVTWIHDAYQYLQYHPQVEGVIWFNLDKRTENEPNFRIDATKGALRTFNQTFASPEKIENKK